MEWIKTEMEEIKDHREEIKLSSIITSYYSFLL